MEFINKNQSIQTPFQLITKILLPISLLSAILCNFQSLAYGLQIFSFSVGKNYMFLLCNGLLVFIATSSGLIGSFSVESDIKVEKTFKISKGELEVESSEPKGSIFKEKVIIAEVPLVVAEDEDEEDRTDELVAVDEEDRTDELVAVDEEDRTDELVAVDEEDRTDELVAVDEEDRTDELVAVDEDEEIGFMSNEELNKKCEEFIRKMKQGIKIEACN